MAGWLKRIVYGSDSRRSRFHDALGTPIPGVGLRFVPMALSSTALRIILGYRPMRPWISYRAQNDIASFLRPESVVLEFGSGMSTVWLARRCAVLDSIEHNGPWHGRVTQLLAQHAASHARVHLREEIDYPDLSAFPTEHFDFILIDGIRRDECVQSAISRLKPGGFIYLDNTDRYVTACSLLTEVVTQRHGRATYYTDFAPTSFVATQGLLAQLP